MVSEVEVFGFLEFIDNEEKLFYGRGMLEISLGCVAFVIYIL